MTKQNHNGTLIITDIHNGQLIKQKYQGYTVRQAIKKFKQHLKTLNNEK